MHLHNRLFFLVTALTMGACSSTTAGDPGSSSGASTGGATAADTSRCKRSCDKMKFFECNSADEQARCYGDCNAATPSQIEIFTGCADSSICDPQCRTTIQPKETAQSGGGGASAATCSSACDKLVTCSLIPVGAKPQCNSECSSKGYQYQIDCVNKTACDKIQSVCGGGSTTTVEGGGGTGTSGGTSTTSVDGCLSECDSINFFACAPVASHATCRDHCAMASATTRDTFTSCSRSSGVDCERKGACLDAFLK
jgi:hypothetical protein